MKNPIKLNKEIIQWHRETFPNCTFESQLVKLEEELSEVVKAHNLGNMQNAYEEMADVYIVALVLAKRYKSHIGIYFVEALKDKDIPFFVMRIKRKMEINKRRNWVEVDGVYRHTERSEDDVF